MLGKVPYESALSFASKWLLILVKSYLFSYALHAYTSFPIILVIREEKLRKKINLFNIL